MPTILLLFHSRGGLTEPLAEAVAEGVRSVPGATLHYRRLGRRVAEFTQRLFP